MKLTTFEGVIEIRSETRAVRLDGEKLELTIAVRDVEEALGFLRVLEGLKGFESSKPAEVEPKPGPTAVTEKASRKPRSQEASKLVETETGRTTQREPAMQSIPPNGTNGKQLTLPTEAPPQNDVRAPEPPAFEEEVEDAAPKCTTLRELLLHLRSEGTTDTAALIKEIGDLKEAKAYPFLERIPDVKDRVERALVTMGIGL